jgi:hypothetical protein
VSVDKNLTIVVKSNLREGQSLVKFLNDLASTGNKVAKSLQAINLGGAGSSASKGGLAKALLEQKNLFNDLGKAGEKLSRILTNEVARSTENLDRQLDKVNKRLAKALEIHERFQQKLAQAKTSGGDVLGAEGDVSRAGSLIEELSVKKSLIKNAQGALGSGSGSLGLRALLQQIPGLGFLGGGLGIYGLIKGAQFAKSVAQGVYSGNVDLAGRSASIAAESGRATGGFTVGAMTGDLSQAFFTGQRNADPRFRDFVNAKGEQAGFENGFFNSEINPMKWFSRMSNQQASVDAARKTAEAEFLQMKMDADVRTKFGLDFIQNQAGNLVAGARRTGMSTQNFGINSMANLGISSEQRQSILLGLVGGAGRGAAGLAGSVASSHMRGMDLGTATGIAAGGAVGGDLLAALRKTGLDPTAVQEALGHGAAGFMGPGNLIGSMDGLVQTLSSGVGGTSAEQLRAVQQNIAGMQGGQALFSGTNPWQKTINLANAVAQMPGGTLYAQNKLANLDFATLVGLLNSPDGKMNVPAQLGGLGITEGAIRGQAKSIFQSTLARFIDQGGNDEASRLARSIQTNFGGDIRAFGRSKAGTSHNFEVLAGLLSETDEGTFGGDAQALGTIRDIAGRGAGHTRGGGGKPPGTGDTSFDILVGQIAKLNEVVTALLTPMGDLNTAAKTAAASLSLQPFGTQPMTTQNTNPAARPMGTSPRRALDFR